jgi:serine/threonine protein kinase/tetratricopeptide (TPR) repeat protein
MTERDIFIAALQKEDPAERQAYLDEACAEQPELRPQVEHLLRLHEGAGSFLEKPAAESAATGALPDAAEQAAPEVLGPYKLIEPIGEGGMGSVWMAQQTEPVKRLVAVKLIKAGMDSRQVIARFEAERQALALMDHANIARVLDAGTTGAGRPYFVMDLVKGVPITRYCDEHQLTPRQRLELFFPVCQAIQHAHQKGIIHRDLKPSNVLVALYDGKPVPKVIDFGVAKAAGQSLTDKTLVTGFGAIVGTLEYMSPEQAEINQLDVDTRSDIYSLGVLLYELLTGSPPFNRKELEKAGMLEMLRVIREQEPSKPSTKLSTAESLPTLAANRGTEPAKLTRLVRGELDWIVMKALEKDRSRRYETAIGLAQDVQRYLADEAVLACPPSAGYRFHKFARRNKAILGVGGLVLFFLLLIGGGVGAAWRDRAARQAKLNLEIEHALDDAARGRELAQKLADNPFTWGNNPFAWEAALAEAASELKRAQGLAAQDETALEPATRERLQALQALLSADEADQRFAARFEEIRLEQAEVNLATSEFKFETAFTPLKEAFQRYYGIAFGVTPVEQAATILQQRPKHMQDVLLATLELCLDSVPKEDRQAPTWLNAVLDGADTGPWRKRAQLAVQASNWEALEQVVEEAFAARQPPSLLLRLAWRLPQNSASCLKLSRRICQAYPGDFWANHGLALILHLHHGRLEEAIRYYTAALALRPHNPAACANLGCALRFRGELDGATRAYREALDRHPDYTAARADLIEALDLMGDMNGAIAELREGLRLVNNANGHLELGNVLFRTGHRNEAVESYKKAVALDPNLAAAHYNLGTALLERQDCLEEAIASFRNAIDCQRRVVEDHPRDSGSHNQLAWFLVTCPYVALRDPVEGLKLARKAVEMGPCNGGIWNTLGAAHYLNENWKEAVAALERSMQLRHGGDSYDWFFLAMAHWQRGEKEEARQWFDRAVAWMDRNMPKGKELGRLRAEAAALMQIDPKKA